MGSGSLDSAAAFPTFRAACHVLPASAAPRSWTLGETRRCWQPGLTGGVRGGRQRRRRAAGAGRRGGGVGKSALVEAFAATSGDARWLWGACDGLFTPRPLGPLFDLADDLGGDLLALCRAQAPREELFGALLRQLSEAGHVTVVVVVVVEDIHWADEATLDLLRFLGRRTRNSTVMIIATYRDDELAAGDILPTALGELSRPAGHPADHTGAAVGRRGGRRAAASGLDAAELYRLTGGNPFYVTETVAAGLHQVPAAARDATLARAAGLSGPARQVLETAALTGTRCEPDLLAAAAGCPPEAVAEAVASGLLVDDGGGLRFRHEIARLAVEQSTGSRRLGGTHARILAALMAAGCTDDARLAFHAEGAGDAAAVMRYAPAAAARAASLASHREAAAQYRRAIRFADLADATALAGLCDGLAWECSLIDRWPEAADASQRALELWRQADDRQREGASLPPAGPGHVAAVPRPGDGRRRPVRAGRAGAARPGRGTGHGLPAAGGPAAGRGRCRRRGRTGPARTGDGGPPRVRQRCSATH